MEKWEIIRRFASKRPEAVGVYGYGSKVFKQRVIEDNHSLIDVIFVVDDIASWHHDNMESNPQDYSLLGKVHFNKRNLDKLKGKNKITYLSGVKDEEYSFKYGVIEVTDFLHGLETWDNLFVGGRFHKPVLTICSSDELDLAIESNRQYALMIACLFSEEITTISDLLNKLCGLSYLGDARMTIAENPHKVNNIVRGSLLYLKEMYLTDENYIIPLDKDTVLIKHDVLLSKLEQLPSSLLEYLGALGTDFRDLDILRINIYEYLVNKNKKESRAQIIEGLKTNGVVRSVPYVLAKVKKRFQRN